MRTEVSKIIRNVSADPPFHTEGKQLSSMKIMSCLVQPSLSIKNHSTFKLHFFGEISNWQNYWHERPWKSKGLFFYHSSCLSRIQKNNTNSLSFKKKKTQSVPKGHTKNWMLKLSVILHGCYFLDGRHFRTTINAGSSLWKYYCQKKPGSNINLIYSNNNGHSALLNIIMELERALGILLETTVNYYKDNIDNNIQ